MSGLLNHRPDFAMIVVSALHGVVPMTLEHARLALASGTPSFIVVSNVDRCSEKERRDVVGEICRMLAGVVGGRRVPLVVEVSFMFQSSEPLNVPFYR